MKLVEKITRNFIINSAILIIPAILAAYLAISLIIKYEIDEKLLASESDILDKIETGIKINYPPFIEIEEIPSTGRSGYSISDTLLYSAKEKEDESYRQLVSYRMIGGIKYKISIRSSLIETEDLMLMLTIIFVIIFALIMLLLFVINRKTAEKIFRPFHRNLRQLTSFSLRRNSSLDLQPSGIDEFNELNESLKILSEKAQKEYNLLKEFTGDLSHELQTPVAVIKSKLELLLQKDFGDDEVVFYLAEAYRNTNRVDSLNKSLILLAKLESPDMFPAEQFLINEITEKMLGIYSGIIEERDIKLSIRIDSPVPVSGNHSLAEILVGNLVSNAVVHNIKGGRIEIFISGRDLTLRNTGNPPHEGTELFFGRFKKSTSSGSSLGLGLAIVSKICGLFGYEKEYHYSEGMHLIKIHFK